MSTRHSELLFDVALVDVDPFFIHYTAYPNWMDRGFMALLKQAGYPLSAIFANGYGFPLVKCQVEFLAPARLDDRLRLVTMVGRLGTTSMIVHYSFTRLNEDGSEELLARGETVHVCVDSATKKRRPLPDWVRQYQTAEGTGDCDSAAQGDTPGTGRSLESGRGHQGL